MLAGKSNPNFDFVIRLMGLFPMLNGNWLVMGIGDMFVDPTFRPKSKNRIHPTCSSRRTRSSASSTRTCS
jgi:hypothetical protein